MHRWLALSFVFVFALLLAWRVLSPRADAQPPQASAVVPPALRPVAGTVPDRRPRPAARSVDGDEGAPGPTPVAEPEPPAVEVPAQTVWPANQDGIDGAVREVIRDVLRCYQQALQEFPELQGDLQLTFRIEDVEGMGQVTELGIAAGDLEDLPMEDCVLDHFETLQFDPPDGGLLDVTYPLVFSSE